MYASGSRAARRAASSSNAAATLSGATSLAEASSLAASQPRTCCASSRASRFADAEMPASRNRSLAAATYSRIVLGDSGRVFQLFRLVEHADVFEQLRQLAVQHAFEL